VKVLFLLATLAVLGVQAQTPDFNGVWLPKAVYDIAAGVDVPLLPGSKAKFEENSAAKQSETDRRCLPPGVPRIMLMPRPFEIVQTPSRILFLYEGGAHVWRQVWMDGRAHAKDPNPDWLGHSIGHWESGHGDAPTLVADSIGFNDKTWLDDAGHPHTEQLHVIERFTRTSATAMRYEITIDDPGAYARPWTARSTLSFRPGQRLEEDICLDRP
jgi:hypothetical protein